MRTAVRTAATALVVAALAGIAATTLTVTALLADELLIGEVIPAAVALTAGGLHLAVANLFVSPRPTRVVAARPVGRVRVGWVPARRPARTTTA